MGVPSIARIWRLSYGPCWCQGEPPRGSSFEFMRRLVTPPSSRPGVNLLMVSNRVLDGSAGAFAAIEREVPSPRFVVSTAACPASADFWNGLPIGWSPVDSIMEVDAHIEECVSGYPHALVFAVLDLLLEPRLVEVGTSTTANVSPTDANRATGTMRTGMV